MTPQIPQCLNPEFVLKEIAKVAHPLYLGDLFTRLVDVLRDPEICPNVYVNDLLKLTWRLVGNDKVNVAAHSQIPSLSFIAVLVGEQQISRFLDINPPLHLPNDSCFLLPMNWLDQCQANLTYCLGGMVFNASQCRDHFNKKLDIHSPQRAMAYEAEFLHWAMKQQPFVANEYQQKVMATYPQGIATIRPLLYDCQTFLDAH
jgi:hypothetical protein